MQYNLASKEKLITGKKKNNIYLYIHSYSFAKLKTNY